MVGNSIALETTVLAVVAVVILGVAALAVAQLRLLRRVAAERDAMAERLRESEARYRAIAENSMDLVSEVRPDGSFVFASSSYGAALGYSREELRRVETVASVHEDDWPRIRDLCIELFRSGAPFLCEHRLRHKDGSYRWYEIAASSYLTSDGERRLVGITRDISSRKAAQEALRSAELQLAHSQKMEAIGRLAGGVAHDFNNHLTVITGYSEQLAKEFADGVDHDGLAEILSASEQAAVLTSRLLAFSRRRPVQPRVIDCNDVLGGLGVILERLIGEDVKLRIRLEPSVGAVRMDPGQLEQVVMNLAVNARDAMPEGGSLTIATERLELAPAEDPALADLDPGSYVCISVEDSGSGMDPATSARIFEPFFTTKPEGAGTGLGLSSAYGAVTQNGGAMLVDSEPGAGATFRLLLPCAGERAPSAEVPVPASPARPTEATILLVDDDDPVRRLLRSALQREGYRVVDAPGPSQALAIWREVGEIALLVTDVVMPGMTGVRLYERLVEDGCSCRVIFISGYARSLGADAELVPSDAPFLEKPFGPRELLDAVRGSLEKGDATRGTGTVPA